MANELEECVFTLKQMNQYFAEADFKHPVDYQPEWFSYNTGQHFMLDKVHNRVYSYFVDENGTRALDIYGKASLITIPFSLPSSKTGAVVIDKDSGKWGSFLFYENKIVSQKMGELNPLAE